MSIEISDNIFREYDIRGKFGQDLTVEVTELIGAALALTLKEKLGTDKKLKISIGRDVRLSSNDLRDALFRGLSQSGINCIDIGECPTPLQYFSVHTLALDGGVMITGSHNPPEYNGFKISVGKETIHGGEIQELKEVVKGLNTGGVKAVAEDQKGTLESYDIITSYLDYHTDKFSDTLPARNLDRPVKVVIDSGNGTGGLAAPELLRKLGCDVVELFSEPDGNFPNHHPDPTVEENLAHLKAEIERTGADFGIGYDGDADRIGVVDEKGSTIWGDQLLVIFARSILNKTPNATIVGEVKCSQVMYDEITRLGGNAVMWKTGHSLIKSKMKQLKAAMAGEMSGHIFFADRYFGFDDALYASARLVEILAERRAENPDAVFSDLLAGLPQTIVTPEYRVECPDEEKFAIIERLKESVNKTGADDIRELIDIDGLRIVFEGGWALVRASNTQPVLVMRYEAESPELLDKYKAYIRARLEEAQPGCVAPA